MILVIDGTIIFLNGTLNGWWECIDRTQTPIGELANGGGRDEEIERERGDVEQEWTRDFRG